MPSFETATLRRSWDLYASHPSFPDSFFFPHTNTHTTNNLNHFFPRTPREIRSFDRLRTALPIVVVVVGGGGEEKINKKQEKKKRKKKFEFWDDGSIDAAPPPAGNLLNNVHTDPYHHPWWTSLENDQKTPLAMRAPWPIVSGLRTHRRRRPELRSRMDPSLLTQNDKVNRRH